MEPPCPQSTPPPTGQLLTASPVRPHRWRRLASSWSQPAGHVTRMDLAPSRACPREHRDRSKRPPRTHLAGPGVSEPQPPEEGGELVEGDPAGSLSLSPCPLHAPRGAGSAPRPGSPIPTGLYWSLGEEQSGRLLGSPPAWEAVLGPRHSWDGRSARAAAANATALRDSAGPRGLCPA